MLGGLRARSLAVAAVLVAVACSSPREDRVSFDAAIGHPDADEPDAGMPPFVRPPEPEPPEPPRIDWLEEGSPPIATAALPMLAPCPMGWREVDTEAGAPACAPWPADARPTCTADDESVFPGDSRCRRIGGACPSGPFALDLPSDRPVLHVLASAPSGGDGSRARPFARLADALSAATPDSVVALGEGTYDAGGAPVGGVELRGACVARTTVTTPAGATAADAALSLAPGSTTLRDLRIEASRGPALRANGDDVALALESVLIVAPGGAALELDAGASVEARDLVVRAARETSEGAAIELAGAATLAIDRAVLEGCRGGGLRVTGAASATARDVAILGTHRTDVAPDATAIEVAAAASLLLERAVIDGSDGYGVLVRDPGSTLSATHLVVRGTLPVEGSRAGGVSVIDGASASVSRAWLRDDRRQPVRVAGAASVLALADAIVGPTPSAGLVAVDGATLRADRVTVVGTTVVGLSIAGAGVALEASDLSVTDVRVDGDASGAALLVGRGASASVERGVFERNTQHDVAADGDGTTVTLADVVLRRTASLSEASIHAQSGASVRVERGLVAGARYTALQAQSASTLAMLDVHVQGVEPRLADDSGGIGVALFDGSSAVLSRVVVERCHEAAVLGQGDGAMLELSDVVLRHVEAQRSTGNNGQGLILTELARASLRRAWVLGTTEGGIDVENGSELDASDVRIEQIASRESSGTLGYGLLAVGACVVRAERVSIESTRTAGALAFGGELALTDVAIVRSLAAECAELDCAEAAGGIGVLAASGSRVAVERFLVSEAALCGVMVADQEPLAVVRPELRVAGELDLRSGVVRGAPSGACVQVPDYDLARLGDRVLYEDNGVNLHATSYPPPSGLEDLAGLDP